MQVVLERKKYHSTEILGFLVKDGKRICATLEPPWLQNKEGSCLPEGLYEVERDKTGKFQYFKLIGTEQIKRYNIELHNGNFAQDTKGCILCGEKWAFLYNSNSEEIEVAVTSSSLTMKSLIEILPERFELLIERKDF